VISCHIAPPAGNDGEEIYFSAGGGQVRNQAKIKWRRNQQLHDLRNHSSTRVG